jgi:hypothetical protein
MLFRKRIKPLAKTGAPAKATASTRQYQAAVPLGRLAWVMPMIGQCTDQTQVPSQVPSTSR